MHIPGPEIPQFTTSVSNPAAHCFALQLLEMFVGFLWHPCGLFNMTTSLYAWLYISWAHTICFDDSGDTSHNFNLNSASGLSH